MIIHHNYLRMYRKKSQLTQNDVAYILNLGDYSNVSRWEHGQRQPAIETLLTYHLLFNLPIELLFERQKKEIMETVVARINTLLGEIGKEPSENKTAQRSSFLTNALNRLTALSSPYA